LTLSEAIEAYEQSVEIARACNQLLDNAELRIRTIDARLTLNGHAFDDETDSDDVPFG
jgi:exonuclease VII small subunit